MIKLLVLVASFLGVNGLENGLARTPPMGWMTWQRFRCTTDCELFPNECISEALIKRMADVLATDGYLDAGYEYLIIDDCWLNHTRDYNGRLQPNYTRFPNGMKALGKYIHSLGLKYGIYEDYGTKTCAGYPGVIGHMDQDAATFAEWEVDYVKLDGCHVDIKNMSSGYTEFGRFLNKTGRPMVYSCSWPAYTEPLGIPGSYKVLTEICNLWRNWDDIDDSWESVKSILTFFADNQDRLAPYAGPGHWNDPDMCVQGVTNGYSNCTVPTLYHTVVETMKTFHIYTLLIGNFGLSYEQSKAQMGIWAILAAPLIMSNDLETISAEMKAILLNKAVIAVNQDKMGIQGKLVLSRNKINAWVRPVEPVVNGYTSYAIGFLSYRVDGMPLRFNFTFTELGLINPDGYGFEDLFESSKQLFEIRKNLIISQVNPSGIRMLKATALSTF